MRSRARNGRRLCRRAPPQRGSRCADQRRTPPARPAQVEEGSRDAAPQCGFFTTDGVRPLGEALDADGGAVFVFVLLLAGGAQDLADKARVQRVSGAMGGDLAGDRASDQGEVAEKIEDLVADEFIAE